MRDIQRELRVANACGDAQLWAKEKSAETIWNTCDNVDWLTWWLNQSLGVKCDFDVGRQDCFACQLKAKTPNEIRKLYPTMPVYGPAYY